MLNYNLTKNDIAYLRILLAIQLCESKKNRRLKSTHTDTKHNIDEATIRIDQEMRNREA